jgi:hypothetical protein
MGTYGQELLGEAFLQMLGAITHLCGAICTTPPTSIVGAILWIGYFGEAMHAQLRAGHLPIAFVALGLCLALTLWGALGSRDKGERSATSR